jgi:hypothetical protein
VRLPGCSRQERLEEHWNKNETGDESAKLSENLKTHLWPAHARETWSGESGAASEGFLGHNFPHDLYGIILFLFFLLFVFLFSSVEERRVGTRWRWRTA